MKTDQFESKITKMKVSTFWIPEICHFPAGGLCQPAGQQVLSNICPARGQIFKTCKCLFACQGPYSSVTFHRFSGQEMLVGGWLENS